MLNITALELSEGQLKCRQAVWAISRIQMASCKDWQEC